MKFETFKAGRWQQRYQYKSFEPVPVNHDWIWKKRLRSAHQPPISSSRL